MKEIPQNCIDAFKEKFKTFPSIVKVHPNMDKEETNKFLGRAYLLWYEDFVTVDYEIKPQHRLYEYDSTGILIYRKSECEIFILTKVDKKNVVEFMLSQLKRLKIKQD
jgi:hypothetical protein